MRRSFRSPLYTVSLGVPVSGTRVIQGEAHRSGGEGRPAREGKGPAYRWRGGGTR